MNKNHHVIRFLYAGFFLSASLLTFNNCDEIIDASQIDTVTDVDGNVYLTVQIGNQLWMAENLKTTHYRNGDAIPRISDSTKWINSTNTGAYCYYKNNSANKDAYGCLYSWGAVCDNRKIAPEGWHIPGDTEWQELIDYLGGGNTAGGKMKEAGTSHWLTPNTDATNESGFTALPGGNRDGSGIFLNMGIGGIFWSSTDSSYYARGLHHNTAAVIFHGYYNDAGYSVRCIKDK